MCIGCRQRRPKRELLKIVLSSFPYLSKIEIDLHQRAQGRGAYICSKQECLNAAANIKKLSRAFRTAISPDAVVKFKSKLLKFQTQTDKAI